MKREIFDMSMLKNKISALELDENSDYCQHGENQQCFEDLPLSVKKCIHALEQLDSKRAKVVSQFREELLELERKYLERYNPIYQRRFEIISGASQPSEEELAGFISSGVEEITKSDSISIPAGIPLFWLTALSNHPDIQALITENDVPAMEALTDIRLSYLEGKPGFRLDFEFAPNEFFFNSVLSKEYHLADAEGNGGEDYIYEYATGSKIDWKPNKNLCYKIVVRTQRHRTNNTTRTVKREEKIESFFHFFSPPIMPDESSNECENNDEDIAALEDRLQTDYEIGDVLKEHIIPHAIDWFTGKALEELEMEDEDDFDSQDEEDDEEEDDQHDDYDEDDTSIPHRRTPSGNRLPSGEQPDCKQQ